MKRIRNLPRKSSRPTPVDTTRAATLSGIIHPGRSRLIVFIVLFLTLSAAVPYVIIREMGAGFPRVDVRWLSWPFLVACGTMLVLYFASDGLRLHYTLKALGHRLPLGKFGPLVFINILVSNITPMATGGGLAQVCYLRRQGIHFGAATAATTLRTLQAVAFIFIPTPFLLLLLDPLQGHPLVGWVSVWLAVFAIAYLIFFGLVLWRMRWLLAIVDALLDLVVRWRFSEPTRVRGWRFGLRREMFRFSHATRIFFRGAKKDVLLALFFTALFLLTLFSFPALLLWGLDYPIDYPTSVGLLVVTTFIMYFAPTPGGAGIAEGAFGLFFLHMVDARDLPMIMVAWRFLTIYLGMLIGVPIILRTVLPRGSHRA